MRIRWTPPAVHDLTRICDYIDEHSSAATSRRVALLIYRSVASLQKFPERGRPGRKTDTRELIVPGLPYVVVYRVHERVVEIVRILHGAQQWP
jgi:toxin ParE1/3/4